MVDSITGEYHRKKPCLWSASVIISNSCTDHQANVDHAVDFNKLQIQHKCVGYCTARLNLTELIKDMWAKYYSQSALVVWIPVDDGEHSMPITLSTVGIGNYIVCRGEAAVWLSTCWRRLHCRLHFYTLNTFSNLIYLVWENLTILIFPDIRYT